MPSRPHRLLLLCTLLVFVGQHSSYAQPASTTYSLQQTGTRDEQAVYLPVLMKAYWSTPAIIPDTTNVIDDQTAGHLIDVSRDGSTFTFDQSTPGLAAVSAGEVIVSGPTEMAPDGFLRRVTAVDATSERVIVRTVPATLEDAIQQGSAGIRRSLTPADVESWSSLPGVRLATATDSVAATSFVFEIDDVVLYDQDGDHETTGDQVVADGSLELAPDVEFGFLLHDWKIHELRIILGLDEEVDVEIGVEATLVDAELSWEIAHLRLGTMVLFVGPVPVVFSIEMPIYLRVDGELSAGVRAQVTQTAKATAGLRYANTRWSRVSSLTNNFSYEPPRATVGASVRAYIDPPLGFLLYGSAGPFASVTPYLEFEADPLDTPWWELYGGIAAEVGVKMEILGHSLGEHKETVISSKTLLAQATGEVPPPAPTATPDGRRRGAWVDRVRVVEEPEEASAIARLASGEIDVYAAPVSSPRTVAEIRASGGLDLGLSFNSTSELTFNPAPCADRATLNPFADRRLREAMNYLVDREYLVTEVFGGLGFPRWVPVGVTSADRARMATEIRAIELEYAFDPDLARRIVAERMAYLGASSQAGKWYYAGSPVTIIGLIRTEDERRDVGEYFARQLESVGFTVVRDLKSSSEAAQIWQTGDPRTCRFGYYTGGWVSTSINRDASSNFSFYYTPSGLSRPLWQAYSPTEEFADVARRLNDQDFHTMSQRHSLFADALQLAMQDSVRVWLLDRATATPRRSEVEVASSFASSCYGTRIWPTTLRRRGQEGGTLTWASADILTEPWNPVAGTNWLNDTALIWATSQAPVVDDPNTGLNWPYRIASAEVTVKNGLPVSRTLDWVSLRRAAEIAVPGNAWVDWDPISQRFVTADEADDQQRTALTKTVVTYPPDLFRTVRWHDGSRLSVGDMAMALIVLFDRGKPGSAIYDESEVPALQAFLSSFKGIRIRTAEPLTIEYYSDNWSLDVENAIGGLTALWPQYGYGEAPWHTVAVGILAEAGGRAAFSSDKAAARGVDQINFLWGPTVSLLANHLSVASAAGYVPYEATMRAFVSDAEVAERYRNLADWYRERGHFWIGTGPLVLTAASATQGTVTLDRNAAFPDPAGRWTRLVAPPVPTVGVDGPDRVTRGQAARFRVLVTTQGKPQTATDVSEVKWVVVAGSGKAAASGTARAVRTGEWSIDVPGSVTARLGGGTCRVEAMVVPRSLLETASGRWEFVVVP